MSCKQNDEFREQSYSSLLEKGIKAKQAMIDAIDNADSIEEVFDLATQYKTKFKK